jgi:hypothetical protein
MSGESVEGVREHFGKGRLALDPAKSVFINCPFDEEYAQTFDAIVFAVACCGFIPRSALESGDIAVPRMERIVRAIFSSYYSIHDLSRCRSEGDERLARFNMPLELGIAMAHRFQTKGRKHDWLVLVPEKPAQILVELPRFTKEKDRLQTDWGGKAPWADIVLLALAAAARL